jgi:hypothetical protein
VSTEINPDLIAHTEFHKGIWLLPSSRPKWYYFMKKKRADVIQNRKFLKSVDEPLKKLVRFLHQKGIKTTPSCSGHHKCKEDFEKIFLRLQKDKERINGDGLKLRDIETGRNYLYKSKNYILPWKKNAFLKKILSYQKRGVMGIIIRNNSKMKRELLNLKIDGADIKEKDSILFIHINEKTENGTVRVWGDVTKAVTKIFGG